MGMFLLSLLLIVGIFLMLVILIQRGRGGGLAGAFGGLGGQSAFGTKAGDVFTVITIVTAVVWVVLACVTGWRLRVEAAPESFFTDDGHAPVKVESAEPVGAGKEKGDEDEPVAGQKDGDKPSAEKPDADDGAQKADDQKSPPDSAVENKPKGEPQPQDAEEASDPKP